MGSLRRLSSFESVGKVPIASLQPISKLSVLENLALKVCDEGPSPSRIQLGRFERLTRLHLNGASSDMGYSVSRPCIQDIIIIHKTTLVSLAGYAEQLEQLLCSLWTSLALIKWYVCLFLYEGDLDLLFL